MVSSVADLDKVGQKVDLQYTLEMRREVARLLQRDSIGFPGSQPVSFVRSHVKELQDRE